jgi:hypothetical protein
MGTPVRLISHDVMNHNNQFFVKMMIEGQRKNAEMLVESEKSANSKNKE